MNTISYTVMQCAGYCLGLAAIWQCTMAVFSGYPPYYQRVRAGSKVTFTCIASEHNAKRAAAVVTWLKDNSAIDYINKHRFRILEDTNALVIANVSVKDTGLYVCVVDLNNHTAKRSAELIVEDVPDPPIEVRLVSCRSRVAQLQWKLVNENHSPVEQFIIEYNTSFKPDTWHVAKTQLPRDRHFQRITLSPWANYSFRVIAENALGRSKPSLPTQNVCRMQPDIPHHNPKGVCTRNGPPHMLIITWQRVPKEEHNAPGFHQLVRWRRDDEQSVFNERVVPANGSSLTIKEQPVYKRYQIYVMSINQMGVAAFPARMVIGYSTEDVPLEIPQNFGLHPNKEVTSTTADFVWDAVNSDHWHMQGFFVGFKIQFWKTKSGKASLREHSIVYNNPTECWQNDHRAKRSSTEHRNTAHLYNLWPYSNITACVRVLNSKYEGPPSKEFHFRTAESVPGPVSGLRLRNKGFDRVSLTWYPPIAINGNLLGYVVAYKELGNGNGFTEVYIAGSQAQNLTISSLKPEQSYELQVYAKSGAGRGPAKMLIVALRSKPLIPPNFTMAKIARKSLNVTLAGYSEGDFWVSYRRLGASRWKTTPVVKNARWSVLNDLQNGVEYEVRIIIRDEDNNVQISSRSKTIRAGNRTAAQASVSEVEATSGTWRTRLSGSILLVSTLYTYLNTAHHL